MALIGDRALLPIDKLFVAYLALTGALALFAGGGTGALLAALHGFAILALLVQARWRPLTGLAGFLRASYAVLICPLLYAELATLNRFLTERYFDATVIGWEEALFGTQPSMTLSSALPWLPLSEGLHLGYFAYYAIVPAALIGVYVTRGFDALQRTSFGVAAAFFVCYLTFAAFPVAGPRYEFPQIGGEIAEGRFFGLVHAVLEGGSSKGTAFPSSHIAASLAAILGAGREDRRWFWLLIIPEAALAIGTVYGRFHYAVDALAGFLLALAVCAVVPAACRALGGRQPEPAGVYPTQ